MKLKNLPKNKVYYLASPYSTPKVEWHDDIQKERYEAVERVGAILMAKYDLILIEPISSCFYKSRAYNLPATYHYWQTRDRALIDKSDAILVCKFPGYEQSVGVTDEVFYAAEKGKSVYYLDLNYEGLLSEVAEYNIIKLGPQYIKDEVECLINKQQEKLS